VTPELPSQSQQYLTAARWESRLVIGFIVLSAAACGLCFTGHFLVPLKTLAAALVIVSGTAIALVLSTRIRRDYLHINPFFAMLTILPPLGFPVILSGLIQTWMERVGFGRSMRLVICVALGFAVVAAFHPPNTYVVVVLIIVVAATVLLREFAPANWYLVPWHTYLVGRLISGLVL